MNKSISITTSLYNSEKYLKKYFKAVKKFSEEANFVFEIIIISNDTNKKEKEILEKNKNICDIKIINIPRESIYASWNRGVRKSKYNNLAFWNVDDTRFANVIEKALNKQEYDIKFFPFIYKRYINILGIDILIKRIKIDPPEFNRKIFTKEMHCGPSFIFTRKAYNMNGPFDESMKIAGDFDWCARAAKNGLSFIKINKIVGVFRNNGKTLSGSKSRLQQEENEIIYEKYN